MKKLSVFVLLFSLFVFVQAQSTADKNGVITLRMATGIWGIPPKEATDVRSRANRAVFEYFHRTHPHIRIVPAGGIELAGAMRESGFLMSMAGNTAPDVIYVNFRQLNNYLNQNFLYPLDEYLNTPEGREIWQRVHPTIRNEITVNGRIYSVPWMQYVMALYYRRDLFKAAGLNPDRPPRTWDEVYEYAKKLTVPERRQVGIGFGGPEGQSWYWVNFLWQAGGDVFRKGPDGRSRAVFNSPEGVVALNFWKRLFTETWVRDGKRIGPVAYVGKEYITMVDEGRVGMWMTYTSDNAINFKDLNLSNIGIAALPAGPAGQANEINAGMWGINNQLANDKRKRDACWEFIKFMGSEEAARVRTKAYVDAGLGKVVEPTLLEKFGYHEYLNQVDPQWVAANKEAFKHGRPEPHAENSQQIYNELDQPLQAIVINPNADKMQLLNRAADRVNTILLGYRPAEEVQRDRQAARVVLGLLIAAAVAWAVRAIVQARRKPLDLLPASRAAGRGGVKTWALVWLFMLPALGSILLWAYYPLMRGLVIAFQDYKILGGSSWIGVDNFIEVARQETFWLGLRNSVLYVSLSLGIGFFVPIILAIMLSEVPRGKMFFRTVYYLPAVTSALVTIFLWQWFYDPSPQGLFNTLIQTVGMTPQRWLNDPALAMLCVVIPAVWAGAGPGSIIYLAALKTIPDDLYEAADLDGANIWHKIRHIVLPGLKPLIIINLVGAFIGAFKAMENIFVMTGGGPLYSTHTLGLEIWQNAFMFLKFGYATAAAWVMGALLVGFTMLQLRFLLNMQWGSAKA